MEWLSSEQALALLGVRPQTLYANVSRGRIRTRQDPGDPRRRLYNGQDVRRLARRRPGRRAAATVAAETLGWGEPVLPSGISTIAGGRLWYRGRDAITLAETATLEEIADLLWQTAGSRLASPDEVGAGPSDTPLRAALLALAARAGDDPPSRGRTRGALIAEAAPLVGTIAAAMTGGGDGAPLHVRMAAAWGVPDAEDVLRRALVLLADHELNASTFAVRVAVSTGAPLSAALIAGLATLAGPLHGGAWSGVRALVQAARQTGPRQAVRGWLAQGHSLPAFGHPLYTEGDPRAVALFDHVRPPPLFAELRVVIEELTGERPNIDFALSALADAFGLPETAPFTIFATARSVGWIAHALEQLAAGTLIRPRARYTGPPIELPAG